MPSLQHSMATSTSHLTECGVAETDEVLLAWADWDALRLSGGCGVGEPAGSSGVSTVSEVEPPAIYIRTPHHTCMGPGRCPHITLNDDRMYVCTETGACFGTEQVSDTFGGWGARREGAEAGCDGFARARSHSTRHGSRAMASRSAMAVMNAATMSATELPVWMGALSRGREERQGARCVGAPPPRFQRRTRTKTGRLASGGRVALEGLFASAMGVIKRLIHCDGVRTQFMQASTAARIAASTPPDLVDAFQQRYVRECMSRSAPLNVHVILDQHIGVRAAIREARTLVKRQQCADERDIRVEVMECIANMTVALWCAAIQSPYLKDRARVESFRPFVSGVLYALGRGIHLTDGTLLIPPVPAVAMMLPSLRMAASSSVKQLQASSHRGLCILQRSLNSIGSIECQRATFERAVVCATALQHLTGDQ